jgi:tetratricopeptide (TPR) repeat protein
VGAVGLVVALCGAAWFGWHQRDAIEGVIYSSGLVQSPEVKTAWRAAQALRRDPTQGLVAVVEAYQRVLAINPNHERTHGVLHMLAETWHADIVAALSADDLTLAETRLNEALTAFPTDDSFGALFDDLGNLKRAESLVTSTEALLRSRGLDDQPSATTAIQAYHEVLRLHPGNARARSGLDGLARHYGTLANGAADDGDVTFAMSYLQIAAAANAQYATLASAREKIQRATTLQQEILTLLQQAEQQVSRGALVDPPGSNAAELFRRVLATDPENATASSGLARVASEVQSRADRLFAAGRIDELRRLVERSGEVGLNASLVQQLQRSLNTEQRRLAEVDRLLREAGEMLANGYITAPADGNAVERLVRLLRIDPDHREARRMLRSAAERLADVAQEAHAVGMSAEARQYMELALGVVPDQAEWRRLLQDWSGTRRAARLADGDHTVPLGATDP